MTDLLLICFTLALLFVIHLIRLLMAVRIPSNIKFKAVNISQPPEIMADLFNQTDSELASLGFERSGWASIQTSPPLPGFLPPLVCLYQHRTQPVVARVSPPFNLLAGDHCQVLFLSRSRDKTYLATANRVPEFFPRPPETESIILNTRVDSLEQQFHAHTEELVRRGLPWRDHSAKLGAQTWSTHLASRYEQKSLQWFQENGFVRSLADGASVPRFGMVLRFLWRLFTGRVKNPPHETQAIPPRRAAYLFGNWAQTQRMPPPLSVQLGIFLVSALAFVVLAGNYWGWDFALPVLGVILFHEAGHWLTMRLLGYRNLQILMLPLVGGVTLGQAREEKATHRVLVSLMGPLPGIILGYVILGFNGFESGWITTLGITLLAVNYLNLLPILPFDGGQLLKALIPVRRFGLLILFEWVGAAALLLTGWLADAYFLSALALLPFMSGLALLKRKRVFDTLDGITDGAGDASPNSETAAVIQAIDHSDKQYRPLEKKAGEISEILSVLQLKPAAPAAIGAVLSLYIGTFVVPPIALVATAPKLMAMGEKFVSVTEAKRQAPYDRAIALPMPQLVRELVDTTRRLNQAQDPALSHPLLPPPAGNAAITAVEQRLAAHIEGDYRQFLETGNGFTELGRTSGENRYLLFPVQRVERFAEALSQLYARSYKRSKKQDQPPLVHLNGDTAGSEKTFDLAKLSHMLLVGNPHPDAYLLLDPKPRRDGSTRALLIEEMPGGFSGRYFASLRAFLADTLSKRQMALSALAD